MGTKENSYIHVDDSLEDSKNKFYLLAIVIEIIFLIAVTVLMINFYVNTVLIIGLWGVVIVYTILERFQNDKLNKILEIIVTVVIILCIIGLYKGYQDKQFIKIVQKQEFLDVEYIDLFEIFSEDVEWKCVKREEFTIVDSNEAYRSGSYEGIVKVSGTCYIEDSKERYVLTYYVSKERDKAVPKSLECAGATYYNSTDIQTFINVVYRYYMQNNE